MRAGAAKTRLRYRITDHVAMGSAGPVFVSAIDAIDRHDAAALALLPHAELAAARDAGGKTPLHHVCMYACMHNLNACGAYCLFKAAQEGVTDVVSYLLTLRVDVHAARSDGETALMTAGADATADVTADVMTNRCSRCLLICGCSVRVQHVQGLWT